MSKPATFMDVYPLTIISDRYGGFYSGGRFTAWNLPENEIPSEASSNDVLCATFWDENKIIVGLGNSPDEAAKNLAKIWHQ